MVRDAPDEQWALDALERDKRDSLRLAIHARWAALAIIAILVPFLNPRIEVLYYEALIALFALIGWAHLRIGGVGVSRGELALIFADLALMTFTIVVPNPFSAELWPLPMQYRFGNFDYFYVLLAGGVLTYSWRTIIAFGTWTTVLWLGALLIGWLVYAPVEELAVQHDLAFGDHERMHIILDPNSFLASFRVQEVVVFVIVAVMLAIAARRSQQLLLVQASAERERANLARYFSPNVVAELSSNDEPLKNVRKQEVAVLFVDIVGFTDFSAERSPEEVIEVLRGFHGRMESEVFRFDGTLDKYLGDGLMATFGTPFTGPDDALRALRCVRSAAQSLATWNSDRAQRGEPVLDARFGLHYGAVVLGDIGANRLEYAAIGQAVNIASRLEALTRQHSARAILSAALVEAARRCPDAREEDFTVLQAMDPAMVRGVATPLDVWLLPQGLSRVESHS